MIWLALLWCVLSLEGVVAKIALIWFAERGYIDAQEEDTTIQAYALARVIQNALRLGTHFANLGLGIDSFFQYPKPPITVPGELGILFLLVSNLCFTAASNVSLYAVWRATKE